MPVALDSLGSVDWAALDHAYGPADDVPGLLVALGSADDAARADARYWLRGTILHQGTRYPASVAAVPFLAGIALDPAHAERAFAVDLLADLAAGDADALLAAGGRADGPCADAVAAEAPVLADLLDGPLVAPVARLLAVVGRVDLRPALLRRFAGDPDGRAACLLAVACLDRAAGAPVADEVRRALTDADPDVALVAAVALTRAGEPPGAGAVGHASRSPVSEAGKWPGDPVLLAVEVLAAAGDSAALLAVVEAGPEVRYADGTAALQARAAFRPLLAVATARFPPRGGWTRSTAPALLVATVTALVGRPWLGEPEVWPVLGGNGLPQDPLALATWLGLPAGTVDPAVFHGLYPPRAGAGGPTVARRVGTATASYTESGSARTDGLHLRRGLNAKVVALGADGVSLLVGLAADRDAPLEALRPAVRALADLDPPGVAARVAEWAARFAVEGPPVRYDVRGTVIAHHALALLVALAVRAAREGAPLADVDGIAAALVVSDAFHPDLVELLHAMPPDRRDRWLAAAIDRRFALPWPGPPMGPAVRGPLLHRLAVHCPDERLPGLVAAVGATNLLEHVGTARLLRVPEAVAARIAAHLAERRRWRKAAYAEDVDQVRALVGRHRGLARALGEADPALGDVLAAGPVQGAPAPVARAARTESRGEGKGKGTGARGGGDALRELSHAVVDLVLAEPLFGHLLGRIDRVLTDATPTMGLALGRHGGIALALNPGFFLGLPGRKVRVGALRHEVLHLLFGHPFRADLPRVDLHLLGTAADLVVNEYTGSWPLPADARRHPWPDPPLDPAWTLDATYLALLDHRSAGRSPTGEVWHSDHRLWRVRVGDGGGEVSDDDRKDGALRLDALVDDAFRAAGADAMHGLEPGLQALVLAALERRRATLDWRRTLRLFSANSRRTTIAHTLKRPSRRYGTFPGIRVKRHHRLAVAVDTSGSISEDDLLLFFSEIAAIHRAGSQVVVVECDAKVQAAYAYDGTPPSAVHGRGGTAFEPVMQWLHQADRPFDACVYLTDGHADAPTTRPPCALLWVVTAAGRVGEHLRFGPALRMAT